MTTIEAQNYLEQYKNCKREILEIDNRIEALRESVALKSIGNDDMPHAHNPHDLSDYIVKLEELTDKLRKKQKEAMMMCCDISLHIDMVPDPLHRQILTNRYMLLHKWDTIAANLNYSEQHIYRLHGEALNEFAKVF